MDSFELIREISYKGKIGREREEFCIQYTNYKRERLKETEIAQTKITAANGEIVTCKKGCFSCCVLYTEADIKECEAIVYYLYHNHDALSIFLEQYPKWRQKLREYGDLFRGCEQALRENRNGGYSIYNQQVLADVLLSYKMQNILCPFLHNRLCMIYEVRPYTCANHYVTTPAEWCNPLSTNEPKVYKTNLNNEMLDLSFYYKRLSEPIIAFMPLAVYEILKGGFSYLANVTGLKSLEEEAMSDPEVRAIIQTS